MKIAQVTDCYLPRSGGIEMHVHDLTVHQLRAGNDVEVVTGTPGDAEEDPPWVRRLAPEVANPSLRLLAARGPARDLFVPGAYDAVHVHASVLSPLATAAARAASANGLPTVVTVHSLWSGLGPLPRLADATLGLSSWPVVWTAVSGVAADHLRRGLGGRVAVEVLPNGIDVGFWQVAPRLRTDGAVVVASVMRLTSRKRPIRLLQALRQVRSRLPAGVEIRAVIVGEGPQRPAMERYLYRHAMDDWVSLPGRLTRPQIREILAGADVYVAPAELESFGLAALEARCVGLPVVAMAQGGVGEFVTHGREGLLVPDRNGLTEALVRLCADDGLRAEMRAHNTSVRPELGWGDVLARTDALYGMAKARARLHGSLVAEPAAA